MSYHSKQAVADPNARQWWLTGHTVSHKEIIRSKEFRFLQINLIIWKIKEYRFLSWKNTCCSGFPIDAKGGGVILILLQKNLVQAAFRVLQVGLSSSSCCNQQRHWFPVLHLPPGIPKTTSELFYIEAKKESFLWLQTCLHFHLCSNSDDSKLFQDVSKMHV